MVRGFCEGRIQQWRLPLSMQRAPVPHRRPPRPLRMITRAEWCALPPPEADPGPRLKLPVGHIRYLYTNTLPCENAEECIPLVQKLQKEDMDNGHPDIMYNFLVGSDGTLYEGRGWDYHCAMIKEPFIDAKAESISVAFIGPKTHKVPFVMEHSGLHFRHWADYHHLLARNWEVTPAAFYKDFEPMDFPQDLLEREESEIKAAEMSTPPGDSGSLEEEGIALPEGSIEVLSEVENEEMDAMNA